jgi:uncharacterized protein YaaQ
MMKMIVCIVHDSDKDEVTNALNEAGFQVTLMPSTGAYFRRGNATMIIGVEEDKLEDAIQVIRENVRKPEDPSLKRATIFVIDVARFEKV